MGISSSVPLVALDSAAEESIRDDESSWRLARLCLRLGDELFVHDIIRGGHRQKAYHAAELSLTPTERRAAASVLRLHQAELRSGLVGIAQIDQLLQHHTLECLSDCSFSSHFEASRCVLKRALYVQV